MVLDTKKTIGSKLDSNCENSLNGKNLTGNLSWKQKQWPEITAIVVASLSSFTMGAFLSWTSPSIPIIISPDYPGDITMAQASYLTVIPPLALVFSSSIFAKLPDQIGRKTCLLVFAAGPQIASWGLIAGTTSIEWLYLARVLSGIADSCVLTVLPMYIGEVATPKVRGTWGNALAINFIFGQFIVNAVGAFLSIKLTALSLVAIPIIFLCIFIFMPESPYYLIMKGKDQKAKENLMWLRSGKKCIIFCPESVEQEFKQLSIDVARQLSEPGQFKELFNKVSNRKALFACIVARFGQQFSGISAFNMYINYLFNLAGGKVDPTTSTLIFSGTSIVLACASASLTDKIGRRRALMISCLISCISLTSISVFLFLKDHYTLNLIITSWFPISAMTVYTIGVSVGLACVPTLLLGELFSASIKGKALCFMNIFCALCVASSAKIFEVLMSAYSLYVPFAFFATCCMACSILFYFVIPNTTGKTLEEIQQNFKKKSVKNTPQDSSNNI